MEALFFFIGIILTLCIMAGIFRNKQLMPVSDDDAKKIPDICKYEGACNFAMRELCPNCCPRYNNSIAEEGSE